MHMQIRVKLSSSGSSEGPGAMDAHPAELDPIEIRRGALLKLLRLLADGRYDLRLAGGSGIEGAGEFVFAVEDEQVDDVVVLLEKEGYRPRKVGVHLCEVEDRVGALADCIEDLGRQGRMVHEVFVGTARDGMVPIQLTTVRAVDENA